jgi:zinc-ribbon domain
MRRCKCGTEVAGNARFCPKCGHRFTSALPKVIVWLFVILVAVVIWGSFNNSGLPPIPSVPVATSSPKPPIQPPPKPKTPGQITAEQIAARKAYAKVVDQQLLDLGIESNTFTQGEQAKILVIKDALAGRVRANSLGKNSEMFEQLRTLGFTRLTYTNGFESDLYEGFTWDLTKQK